MDEISIPQDNGLVLTKTSRVGGPVTCVSLPRRDCLVWALGPYLQRSLRPHSGPTTSPNHEQLSVFPRQGGTIHGVHHYESAPAKDCSRWDTVVYGGRQLAFCAVLDADVPMVARTVTLDDGSQSQHLTVADWVWDVQCNEGKQNQDSKDRLTEMLVGMARHMVEVWHIASLDNIIQAVCHRRIDGAESCLVTAMHLYRGESFTWVAAGTAFHEIRVWAMEAPKDTKHQHMLEGHAGVVHSVRFSSDGKSLASTSDDRSVRLWTYIPEKLQWVQKWVGWGHSARVWSVAFAPDTVASSCEDGTTRLWSLETGEALTSLQHGCSLWSVATLDHTVASGATDGTVALYDLSTRLPRESLEIAVPDDRPSCSHILTSGPEMVATEGHDAPSATKKKKKKSKKASGQVIVGLKWLDVTRILLGTRSGSLMVFDVETKEWEQLEPWWDVELQEQHSILATEGCCMCVQDDWVAIGTTRGDIVLSSIVPNSKRRVVLPARNLKSVQGLTWINTTLVSFHVHSVAWWPLPTTSTNESNGPDWILDMGETKGVPLSCSLDSNKSKAFIGDSRGNVSCFILPLHYHPSESRVVMASSVLLRAHHKEHVTDLVSDSGRVLSVGNDGCLHTAYEEDEKLHGGLSTPIPSMSGITHMWTRSLPQSSPCCFVAGYYGNTFRLVDASNGHEFFSIDTGGRQRIHDFFWDRCAGNGSCHSPQCCQIVVCMNQRDGSNTLLLQREAKAPLDGQSPLFTFQDGVSLHGETVFSACSFAIGTNKDTPFLLTGSEDCTAKICMVDSNRVMDSIALTSQESCVRAVCSSQVDGYSALLVVGGGKLALEFFIASELKAGVPIASSHDLRLHYLGKGVTRRNATIDHRINAVKSIHLEGDSRSHLVMAGDSDGVCHLFTIDEEGGRPPPALSIEVSDRPILSIEMLAVHSRILIAVGTTGGDVKLFDLPVTRGELATSWGTLKSTWRPTAMYRAHQMGTNTICAFIEPNWNGKSSSAPVSIVSGGDDQAICSYLVDVSVSTLGVLHFEKAALHTTTGASFSAVKGVAHLVRDGVPHILATGYTQQLCLWRHQRTDQDAVLQVVDSVPVDVGDVNCLAMYGSRHGNEVRLAVGGLGLETFLCG